MSVDELLEQFVSLSVAEDDVAAYPELEAEIEEDIRRYGRYL